MSDTTTATPPDGIDRDDVRLATAPLDPRLERFNLAGVLGPAEVHGARTLCRLTGDEHPDVLLAAALALRAPQHGHVCVELSSVAGTVAVAEESPIAADELEWPDPDAWRERLRTSPLVRGRRPGTPTPAELRPEDDRPLVLVGDRLYLDRYWRYERRVASVLEARARRAGTAVEPERLREALDRLLPAGDERPDRQRLAVATGVLRDLTVIAGGPGTGKTHTVARLLALLHELADGRPPRVAVVAPTGKAADRLTAALREAAATVDTSPEVRERLRSLEASTIHRLLGWRPGTRFAHDRDRKLPHEVVVVDETSMVDLPLMSKLVASLKTSTKLVLVGDPDQLASVEAGAVLADIVGDAGEQLRMSPEARDTLAAATGEPLDGVEPARATGIDDALVVLGTVRRFRPDSGIARLARAIHAGDADAALEALRAGSDDLAFVEAEGDAVDRPDRHGLRDRLVEVGRRGHRAAVRGDAGAALDVLDELRVLCAHRRGAVGVTGWVPLIERWLAEQVDGFDPTARWYVGRPVMVTQNDRRLKLYNGDVGVVVRTPDGIAIAFRGPDEVRTFAPSRLEGLETVHAMTIHKSQGSQFDHVAVVLPGADSQILTRELLYTAVTRAREGITVVGTEDAIRTAITRRVARASGLRETLWGDA